MGVGYFIQAPSLLYWRILLWSSSCISFYTPCCYFFLWTSFKSQFWSKSNYHLLEEFRIWNAFCSFLPQFMLNLKACFLQNAVGIQTWYRGDSWSSYHRAACCRPYPRGIKCYSLGNENTGDHASCLIPFSWEQLLSRF